MSEQDRTFYDLLESLERELDFESGFYNDAYLDRRINARMRRTGHDDDRSYGRHLESDPEERDALLDALSINVTGFFRNPEAWASLRDVLAELTGAGDRVNVWSTPVPTAGNRTRSQCWRSTTTTTDIAEELEPLSVIDPYVAREGDAFTVRDRVHDLVEFERHDLIRGADRRDFELVLCRNFLIYIDADYKAPIVETITGSLVETGYLMTGMTETFPPEFRDRYDPVVKKHRIYRRA